MSATTQESSAQEAPAETNEDTTIRSGLQAALEPEAAARRAGAWGSTVAALIWAPQAYLLAAVLAETLEPGAGLSLGLGLSLFLLLGAARAALSAWATEKLGQAAEDAKRRIRLDIAQSAASWAPLDPSRPSPGRIAALVGEMVETLGPYLSAYEPARKRVEIVPLAFALLAFVESWIAGLIFLVAGPLIPVFMALIGRAAKDASDARLREVSSLSEKLVERLRALSDVRLLGAAERDAAAFQAEADDLRQRTMRVLSIAFLSSAVLEAFSALGIALLAVFIGFSLLGVIGFGTWGAPLDFGSGLFLLLLAPAFFQPLRDFAAAYHDRASADAFGDALAEALRPNQPRALGHGAVAGRRLSASARPVLRLDKLQAAGFAPLTFEIAPGESIALTGPSGAGKSTLLACLAGLRALDAGRILIGADLLSDETAADWRRRIAWIGQKPHLVSGSLRANIAFYAPGDANNHARLDAAIAAAAAQQIVERAPKGLASPVGETAGGVSAGVSGGEARRLGIARLAFADRDVILADEPTADLDAETAAAVTAGLLQVAQGRTLIVATHDEALIAKLDRRLDLEARS